MAVSGKEKLQASILKLGSITGFSPYKWDWGNKRLVKSKSRFDLFRFHFLVSMAYGYTAAVALRFAFAAVKGEVIPNVDLCLGIFMGCVGLSFVLLIIEVKTDSLEEIVNICLTYTCRFSEIRHKDNHIESWKSKCIIGSIIAFPTMVCLYYYTNRNTIIVFPLYFFLPIHNQYMFFHVFVVFLAYWYSLGAVIIGVYFILFVREQLHYQVNIMMKSKYDPETKYSGVMSVREMERIARSQHILYAIGNLCCKYFVLPSQSIILRCVMVSNFALVFHVTLNLSTILLFESSSSVLLVFCIYMLRAASKVHHTSKACKNSWRMLNTQDKRLRMYVRMFCRSWQPIGVQVGDYYTIKRRTVGKFLSNVGKGTAKLLVAV